jgi:hypothetical protein
MVNLRKIVLTGLAVIAMGAIWHVKTGAQENPSVRVVTVFDHQKLDASFAKALSSGGSEVLWGHTSDKGTFTVSTHSRESAKAAAIRDTLPLCMW